MFAKKVVFLVAALFVVQISASPNSQWENAEKLFNDMIERVENAAIDVSSHIQQWAEEEQQRIEVIRANISSKINEGMTKLKEKAEEVGAEVGECFQELPEGGMAVAKNLTMGAVKCVTDEVDQAKDIVSSLIELAKEANATLVEARGDWEECQSQSSGWKAAICQAKVAAAAAMKETQYSVQAGVEVGKATKLISTAKTTMETCAAADMATAALNASKVMAHLGQCIMSKITGN